MRFRWLIFDDVHNFLIAVLDDEDTTITAGSIVTVSVRLVRKSMEELLGNESALQNSDGTENKLVEDDSQYQDDEQEDQEVRRILSFRIHRKQ